MNMMNSCILEGVMTTKASSGECFTLESTRYYKEWEEKKKQSTVVYCTTSGVSVDFVKDHISEGDCVRVVGRLMFFPGINGIGLFVEHVETKGNVIKSGKYNFTREI